MIVDACDIFSVGANYMYTFVLKKTCFVEAKTNINIYLSDIRHNTLTVVFVIESVWPSGAISLYKYRSFNIPNLVHILQVHNIMQMLNLSACKQKCTYLTPASNFISCVVFV